MKFEARVRRGAFELDATFNAPERGVVALFGPSGCGKSTLLEILAGLLQPARGQVEFAGECWFDSERRIVVPASDRAVGYVFQDARLFPHLDVEANLRYGAARARGRSRGISYDDVVGLLGLATQLSRRPSSLSGGERRRVAIGRALLAQPNLLLLDEPFSGLDAPRRAEFMAYIGALRSRMSLPIVLVTHDFDDVLQMANHLVVMTEGRVVAEGEVTQLGLHPALTRLLGAGASGAVIDAKVIEVDASTGLTRVGIGERGSVKLPLREASPGSAVRLQLLSRDLILAREVPQGLSVRNALPGTIEGIDAGLADALEVTVNLGGPRVVASITREAQRDMQLAAGQPIHVLVKAVSVRGHALAHVL